MGLSSSKSTQTQNQNTTQTGTTTPQAPEWVTNSLQNYMGGIDAMSGADPSSFVAGPSPLQQQAWSNADRLGGQNGNFAAASQMALNAGNAPANTIPGATGYTAARGNVSTYSPATLANPREATATGYNAAQGQGTGYNAPALGNATQAVGNGYQAAQAGPVNIDPTTNAQASNATAHTVGDFMGAYKNPYEQQVVDTTLAGMDHNTAQQAAQMQAQAAKAGAFGGSRYGIAQGQFAADNALNRASTEAQLRSAGFDKASQLGATDAGAFNQNSLFNAQNQTGVSQGNAAAANARALSQAGLNAQIGVGNADRTSQASMFGAAAGNTASLANQGANSQYDLARAGLQADAARYGADSSNQFGLANMAAQNQAAAAGAAAQNNASALNQGASNQFALQQAGMQNEAAHYAADANNASTQGYLGRADQAAQYGAGATNAMSLFNAQQGEAGLNRQLQASQLLGGLGNDYASNTRADLGVQASLGDQQRGIEQAYALAPAAQLQMAGSLFGATPYQALVGQTINANGTMNGTNTTTSSPNLFQMLMQAGQSAAQAYAGGGG